LTNSKNMLCIVSLTMQSNYPPL